MSEIPDKKKGRFTDIARKKHAQDKFSRESNLDFSDSSTEQVKNLDMQKMKRERAPSEISQKAALSRAALAIKKELKQSESKLL